MFFDEWSMKNLKKSSALVSAKVITTKIFIGKINNSTSKNLYLLSQKMVLWGIGSTLARKHCTSNTFFST